MSDWLHSANDTWSLAGGLWTNTPTFSGSELLADIDMESADMSSWTASGTPTTLEKSTTQKHGGSQSIHMVTTATQGCRQSFNSTVGYYRASLWFYNVSSKAQPYLNTVTTNDQYLASSAVLSEWIQAVSVIPERTATSGRRFYFVTSGAGEVYYDDCSLKKVTTADCFISKPAGTGQYVSVACKTSHSDAKSGGLIGAATCIDVPTNCQNAIIAYGVWSIGTFYINMDKLVNGVLTLWPTGLTAVEYDPYARIGVQLSFHDGSHYASAWYGDKMVGAEWEVTDTSIINNLYHGGFATDPTTQIDTPVIESVRRKKAIYSSVAATANVYNYCPALEVLPGGTLFAAYAKGDGSTSKGETKDVDIVYRTSTDGGATWSGESTICTHAGSLVYNNCEVELLSNNTLLLSYNELTVDGSYVVTDAKLCFKIATISSDVLTWGSQIKPSTDYRATCGKPIEIGGGSVLQGFYDVNNRVYCIISTDYGANWGTAITISTDPYYPEPNGVLLPNGRIVMFLRRDGTYKGVYRTYADSPYTSWSSPVKVLDETLVNGCKPAVIRLLDGTLLLNGRGISAASTYKWIWWAESSDDGETWSTPGREFVNLPYFNKTNNYASFVQLPNQDIGILVAQHITTSVRSDMNYVTLINRDWRVSKTYYIDATNGNDSYNGLAATYSSGITGPWKTLAKYEEIKPTNGDVIDGGDGTFYDRLTIFGDGADIDLQNASFDGSLSCDGSWTFNPGNTYSETAAWASVAGELYNKACTRSVYYMTEDGDNLTPTTLAAAPTVGDELARGSFGWYSNVLYYRASDGGVPATHVLRFANRGLDWYGPMVSIRECGDVALTDIVGTRCIVNNNNTGFLYASNLTSLSGNVNATYNFTGIRLNAVGSVSLTGTVTNNYGGGYGIDGNATSLDIQGTITGNGRQLILSGSTAQYTGDGDGIGVGGDGGIIGTFYVHNAIISGNGRPDDYAEGGSGLYVGTINAMTVNLVKLKNIFFNNNHYAEFFLGDEVKKFEIHNVIVATHTTTEATVLFQAANINCTNAAFDDSLIYNMVFYNCKPKAALYINNTISTGKTVKAKNIIFCDNGQASNWNGDLWLAVDNEYVKVDNNLWYRSGGAWGTTGLVKVAASVYDTIAAFVAGYSGEALNNLSGDDPLFLNAGGSYNIATDFKVDPDSPAVGAGVQVPATPMSDYEDKGMYDESGGVSIGAYRGWSTDSHNLPGN